ncbi:MAG TPA: S24 family peptidase [Atribacteraceae bacterium]|nr:S24 family peptidase [Atribacteraceae bacterium]
MAEKGLDQSRTAALTGISQSTVSRWLKGEKEPETETALRVGRALGIPNSELLLFLGLIDCSFFELDNETIAVPVLTGSVPCGIPITEYEKYVASYQPIHHSLLRMRVGQAAGREVRLFIVHARGDSMIGERIGDGDQVVFSPDLVVASGDIAVIDMEEEGLTIKKVFFQNETAVLQAANPSYPPLIITGRPLRIVGKVLMNWVYH